jgi:hypothetical protein
MYVCMYVSVYVRMHTYRCYINGVPKFRILVYEVTAVRLL